MNAPLLFQIFAGLVIVLFIVALIMGFKSWRIHTIVMLLLVFLCAVAFMVLSGMVLRTHSRWRMISEGPPGQHEKGLKYRTHELLQKSDQLEFGKRGPDGLLIKNGIIQEQQRMRRDVYDRGRMWQDVKPTTPTGSTVQVTIAHPKPVGIHANSSVYVFDSHPASADGAYLGEFRVTNVNDPTADEAEAGGDAAPGGPVPPNAAGGATVTLEAAWSLSDFEQKRLDTSANKGGPWRIYEKMPPDAHDHYAQLDKATAEELGVDPSELKKLDVDGRLRKLLPEDVVAEFINDYKKPAEDAPPSHIEVLVRFEKDHTVNGAGEDTLTYGEDTEVWLHKESLTKGEGVDQEVIIPGADQLAADKIVTVLDTRYARPLRDYSLLFRKIYLMRDLQSARNDALRFNYETADKIVQEKQAILEVRKKKNQQLHEDREGYNRDEKRVDQLIAEMTRQKAEIASLAEKLRKQNISLARRLDRAQMQAIRVLNRRAPAPQAQTESAGSPAEIASSN